MQFFSGFSLENDRFFFDTLIKNSDFCVCGFSYGAIKAFEYVEKSLENGRRIDRLQLFSPAFFQTREQKFKRLQSIAFQRDEERYMAHFLQSCFAPYGVGSVALRERTFEELEELLYYEWNRERLLALVEKGVEIEVYLGGKDSVIDVHNARAFFLEVATVTYIKDANHFLNKG